MRRTTAIITTICILAFAGGARAAELHVPDDYNTIQAAIDAASDGDTVIVADGTYTGAGNRDIDFLGKAITVRSESGPQNCIVDCQTLGSAFGFHSGEEADTMLDGFTITNGRAGVGAIYCASSRPMVANCIITGNSALHAGGGLCLRDAKPTVTDCTIIGNFADRGGGIYCDNNSSPTIANCTIADNSADFHGGAIHAKDSTLTLINCSLASNSTTYFGGAMYVIDSNVAVNGCTFSGNSGGDGGAAYNRDSTVTIDACIFKHNRAESSGGALYNGRVTQKVANSLFTGNSANAGGAIMNPAGPIINCTFSGNSAYSGGAISDDTFVDVWGPGPGWPIDTPIENCILWGDTPDEIDAGSAWPVNGLEPNWSYVKFCDIQGGYPGLGNIDADPCFVDPGYWAHANDPNVIVGPIDPNAIWVDGDYHLLPTSPCIDAGDPNYISEPNETDLAGRPRIFKDRVDMGAYEYTPPIMAEINIKPRTLNLQGKGKSISCRISLPDGYNVADIDPNSILLEDEIAPDRVVLYGRLAVAKFSRTAVQELLSELQTPGEVELLISGQLTDGTIFEGTDTIRIVGPELKLTLRRRVGR